MSNKWWQVESNRYNGRHIFLLEPCVFCARLASKQLILPTLTRSKLFSSIKDNTNKRKSIGSTAQCGGSAVVLLNLQHHIQPNGQCYTLATVVLGKLTTVSRVGPRVSLHAVVKRKFPPPPEMNSKCHLTSFVWVSAQRVTLATNIKQTIFVIKQRNTFLQMQNNALSTIYVQIQVFLDVTPRTSASSSWHFQVLDSWLSLQVSTPRSFAISGTTDPSAHHILLGLLDLLQHEGTKILQYFLCFVDHASRYDCVKKNQLDAQLILSIFCQPLHVSGISRPIMRRYNHMHTTTGTYYSF